MRPTDRTSLALVVVLPLALFSSGTAFAGEPDWWTQMKAACRSSGGHPSSESYNEWVAGGGCVCPGSASGSGQPTCNGSAAPAPDPRQLQRARYGAVLQRGLVDASAFAARPIATEDEFGGALRDLYDALARSAEVSRADAAFFVAESEAENAAYRDFYTPRFSKIDASDGLDPEIRADNLRAKRELEAVTAELKRVSILRETFVNHTMAPQNAQRLYKEATQASKKRIHVYFGALTRTEAESYVPFMSTSTPRADCCNENPFVAPLYFAEQPVPPLANRSAVEKATKAREAARIVALPTIGGDNEKRVASVEAMADTAAANAKSAAEWREHYEVNVHPSTLSGARTWASIVADNVEVMRQTHRLTQHDTPGARIILKWTRDVLKSDEWEFLSNGGKAAAWMLFRKKLLDPELERAGIELFAGKYRFSDAEVEAAWKQSKPAVFGAWEKNYKRATEADSLIKICRGLDGRLEKSALAMANVMGRADLGDYQEVGDKIFAGINEEARKDVKDALQQTDLPGPVRKFWEGYFSGVKPSFEEKE